jgi:hypothetical protein
MPAFPPAFEDSAMISRLIPAAGTLLALWAVVSTTAAPPQVARVSSLSLQTGTVNTLVIDGTDLGPNPRIVLPVPIESQTVKDGATPTKVQIEVKFAADVLPGIYQMRLASDKGISGPIVVEIDNEPAVPFGPQVAKLPALLHGLLPGSATLSTTLTGKKGQRLIVEVEAKRIGSAIDPVLKLLDPRRIEIAAGRPSNPLAGDTRLVTVLPVDGTYTVELHDLQYKAGTPNRFRMRIGEYPYVDLPFPLAAQRGSKASVALIGSVPDATRVEVDLTRSPGNSFVQLPRVPGVPGFPPAILVSDIPEVIETPQAEGKLQEVTVPVGINGRISKPKEEDQYRIKVQPGTKLKLDVLAERLGSPLDGVLILKNEAGAQLARSDDQPNTLDPGLEFMVPAGVESLIAIVTDANGRGGPDFVYRLSITPTTQPDFSIALLDDRPLVPFGGAALVRVRATRSNYNGPIKLAVSGLPEGITIAGDEIPAGATDTLLSFSVPEGAKPMQAVLQVVGEATENGVSLQRQALLPETPLSKVYPWMRSELAIAVVEPGLIAIAWDSLDGGLPVGATAAGKINVTRKPDAKGTIRLSFLTSQIVPKGKDNKDDVNKSLRLEAVPMVPPGEQAVIELKILVPADLPPMPYDAAVRAELVAADNKTILATATTPSRRMIAAK